MTIESQKAVDLCGIGMSMIDFLQIVEQFPSRGGVTETVASIMMGGGPVPTALCTAAKLGARTAIIDRIGADWKGDRVQEEYRHYGVDTSHLLLQPGKTTTFGNVLVRENDGERHVVFTPGDFSPLEEKDLPIELLQNCKILHLNGRHWPACLKAAKVVRAAGGLVSFDGGAYRYQPKFDELLELTDILIVAENFAAKYSGSNDVAEQLGQLIGTGARIAAVTNGAKGSWFATDEGEVFHQRALPVEPIVDTTGCGDAFHGGFLFALCQNWSLRESALFASAVAAQNLKALGGRGNLPGLTEAADLVAAVH